ncbi:MAG: single-stranded DNA-binding protein [Magnetococcales bacterium]|nr:single-stranded DNA-binding protein [Magnetococcales bacterium]
MAQLEQSSVGSVNETALDGVLLESPEFRLTPAGRAVASLMIEHISEGNQSAPIKRLELRMPIVALGALADQCRDVRPGQLIRVTGRLNQKRWIRDGKVRWGKLELLAQTIQPLVPSGQPSE